MFSRVMHPCQRPPVTLHGVVFDILVGSENRVGNYGFTAPISRPRSMRLRMCVRAVQDRLPGKRAKTSHFIGDWDACRDG
jgi:hypothetical protein